MQQQSPLQIDSGTGHRQRIDLPPPIDNRQNPRFAANLPRHPERQRRRTARYFAQPFGDPTLRNAVGQNPAERLEPMAGRCRWLLPGKSFTELFPPQLLPQPPHSFQFPAGIGSHRLIGIGTRHGWHFSDRLLGSVFMYTIIWKSVIKYPYGHIFF